MEFLELAKKRYSCRSYKNTKIEEDKIIKILETGRIAPSAANKQPWKFVVTKEKKNLEELHKTYHREWFNQCPVVITICGTPDKAWTRSEDNKNHTDVDVSIAIDHMTLQATELSLATCWICNFHISEVKKTLNLPEGIEPIALLSLGYPNDKVNTERHEKRRKPLKDIVIWEKF